MNGLRELLMTTMITTRDKAERELLDDELDEEDGYFIREREISDEEYFEVIANEPQWDDENDEFILGGES